MKNHYYAVLKGHRPGIYTRWSGSEGAEDQVRGYPGAVYRGFATREEAEHFLRTGAARPAQSTLFMVEKTRPVAARERAAAGFQPDLDAGRTVIFTDGASSGNPGPGGFGVVLLHGTTRRELSGGYLCTTNNRMELMGVISGLQALKRPGQVVLYSDSRYVVDAVEKGWARRWKSRGWMRTSKEPAENADLWEQVLDLLDRHQVEFRWVKGHASQAENERCDRLAVQAAANPHLPPDPGYDPAACRGR